MEKENLFEKALKRDELLAFSIGRGEYFLNEPDWGTHWVLGAWLYHIVPYCQKTKCDQELDTMFSLLLNTDTIPFPERAFLVVYHTRIFYHQRFEGNITGSDFLKKYERKIGREIEHYIAYLKEMKEEDLLGNVLLDISLLKKYGAMKSLDINA